MDLLKHQPWAKLNSDFWVERFLNMKPFQLNNENELKDKESFLKEGA